MYGKNRLGYGDLAVEELAESHRGESQGLLLQGARRAVWPEGSKSLSRKIQEIGAGKWEEDEEMRETAREEKSAILMTGTGIRYLVINCCASSRVEVIYGILGDSSCSLCYTEVSLHRGILHCALLQYLPMCSHSTTSLNWLLCYPSLFCF